jgi:hypothetical protein
MIARANVPSANVPHANVLAAAGLLATIFANASGEKKGTGAFIDSEGCVG